MVKQILPVNFCFICCFLGRNDGSTLIITAYAGALNKNGKKLTQQRINIMIYSNNNYKTIFLGFDSVVSLLNSLCRQKLNCAQDHIE